jgi:hypothetical protein
MTSTLEKYALQSKFMKADKVILTDVDGVLLNWEFAFHTWMEEHGQMAAEGHEFKYCVGKRFGIDPTEGKRYINFFNESAAIGFLPPLRDAMYYVKKLHEEHGYVFHAITSLSKNQHAINLRQRNLYKLFGETTFEKIICLGTGADKDEELLPYKDSGCWWIEDKIANAETGAKLGLNSIIMEHGHNMDYTGDIPLVKNWKEIYKLITKPKKKIKKNSDG